MKNICMVAGAFIEYQILKSLMKEIQKDQSTYLTVISTGKHQTPQMDITYRRIEEEGFVTDEKTNIVFNDQIIFQKNRPVNFEQLEYDKIFKQLKPDIIILFGNRYDTLSAAIAASLNDIPIAHIQGGESDFGPWDDSYGYGITKLSHLHFTSAEKYHQQVIRFGEHSERVFNVGSLLIEKIKSHPFREKRCFYNDMGLKKTDQFLFISYHPDASIGSKNRQIFQELLESLNDDRLKNFKLIFNKPEPDGLGKMIVQMIDAFADDHPNRTVSFPFMNLNDFSCALKYCSALVGNSSEGMIISPSFKTPVINIGNVQKDRIRSKNMIDCHSQKQEIIHAIQNGLSADFRYLIKDMPSPFEKPSTAKKIKDTIKAFNHSDMCRKEFFLNIV
ncbi:MAG: UDP-N-acetylglucosamine 2-epimerase (hydrolyzing) [Desulfobacteraceae bacterium]|nr:UDP-N-acetylglucosamine 2-epimerase (hydrolyzing) [Desulfobacteraceae bacterium]